jgi:hypothetical protein
MEVFVDDKVLVELTVKSIIEDKNGLNYAVRLPKEYSYIVVPSDAVKDVIREVDDG